MKNNTKVSLLMIKKIANFGLKNGIASPSSIIQFQPKAPASTKDKIFK